MNKLKNWLLANNFILNEDIIKIYEYYDYLLFINKEETKMYLRVSLKPFIRISLVQQFKYLDNYDPELLLFETDNEDEIDKYWILDTIKFLKR